jgi:dihydrofolate reductase
VAKLKVAAFSISIDGYGAGPRQSLEDPLGVGGRALHEWAFGTRTFQRMFGNEGGGTGTDDDFAARSFENVGASIMGRNMFGPVRGRGRMRVGRDGGEVGADRDGGGNDLPLCDGWNSRRPRGAVAAANGKDVRIGGGVATIQQYLRAGLVDEMHLAISPVVLGSGERLFDGVDLVKLGYRCRERVGTEKATHVVLAR